MVGGGEVAAKRKRKGVQGTMRLLCRNKYELHTTV